MPWAARKTGAASAAAIAGGRRLLQSDVRAPVRRDDGRWLLPAAALSAVVLHGALLGAALAEWPERTGPPIERVIVAELIVEPPAEPSEAQASDAEPEPAAQPTDVSQSGGDPGLSVGSAELEPAPPAPAPSEPASEPTPDPAQGPLKPMATMPELAAAPPAPAPESAPEPEPEPEPESAPESGQEESSEVAVSPAAAASYHPTDGTGGGDRYLNEIRDTILDRQIYPLKQSGTAHYQILIDRFGNLLSAKLALTSGVGIVDTVGMGMIREAAPFPPVPDTLNGDKISLSIRLSLGPKYNR